MTRTLFSLNSDDRTSGSTHDFTIRLPRALQLDAIKHYISIVSVNTWYSNYNIDSVNYNNGVFRYFDGSIYHDVTIPNGQYSFSDIFNIIESYQFAQGHYTGLATDPVYNVSCTANYNTGRIDFVLAAGYKVDFSTNTLHTIFGCDQVEYAASFSSPHIAQITNGVNTFNITCNLAGSSGIGQQGNIICTFVPDVSPNASIEFRSAFPIWTQVINPTAQEIRVSLVDQLSRPIDLNGEPLSILIAIKDV